jgi:tripartite-type tricarboxylate transporter receptor subunit TctC
MLADGPRAAASKGADAMARAILAVAAALLSLAGTALAETPYPTHPIQVVVPFVAGGNTDLIMRVLADEMAAAMGQPVTVITKPGAGANIGAAFVAASEPDGYTLLITPPAPLAINEYLYPSLAFDPVKSFTPVVLVASFPNVLVVPPSPGVKSVRELIDKARAHPGALDYASGGTGSSGQLSSALFLAMAKIKVNHIPYKGTGQSLQDVIAGRIAMTIDNLGPILPFIQSGQLVALGVTTPRQVSLLPGVPPIGDTVPGYALSSWNAIMAPAGTPREVITRLNTEIDRILAKPQVQERLRSFGTEPAGGSVEELTAFIAAERVRWKQAVEASRTE